MVCYKSQTLHLTQVALVGDSPEDVWLRLFADVDFAGDRRDCKSTAVVFLALAGEYTLFPLAVDVQETRSYQSFLHGGRNSFAEQSTEGSWATDT